MKLLTGPACWIGGIVVAAFAAWLLGFFKQFLPSPQRVRLAIFNVFKTRSPLPEQRFRLALCWLEKDGAGRDTGTVAEAFTGTEGIELVRSARVVSAPGAADDWRPAIRKGSLAVLQKWNADVAVVGSVKDPGKALNLWFVPREGDGTLRRGDLPYELVHVTLQDDFHDDLRAQLTAEALRVAAPLAGTEMRSRVLETGLNSVTEKIAALLEGGAVPLARRATLQIALGNTLATLGERESGREHLEQAVTAYTEALKEYTRERVPLGWAMTQNNLGSALAILGERESGTERLEQAVTAFTKALKEYTRERVPLDWAATQNNLGAALAALGERESRTERLKQAVTAYTEALKERTRERVPLDWAATQNNLGAAQSIFCSNLGATLSMLCRVHEVVLAYKHVGGKVPIDRQGPDHRQSERALSVEHFRSAWLGANQRCEVFLAQATGLHDVLDRRDRVRRLYRPVLGFVGFYKSNEDLELVTFRRVRRGAHQAVDYG